MAEVDEVIRIYVELRDQKKAAEAELEERLKPLNAKMEKIEAWLLGTMQAQGISSCKTVNGTAYSSIKTSVTMADPDTFRRFVLSPAVERVKFKFEDMGVFTPPEFETELLNILVTSGRWSITDFRALKSGVEEFIEDNKEAPPGLNITRTTTVNVRRK